MYVKRKQRKDTFIKKWLPIKGKREQDAREKQTLDFTEYNFMVFTLEPY